MWGAVIVMTPFESAVRGSLEGSHGGRAHVRDDHDGATALHHYRGLNAWTACKSAPGSDPSFSENRLRAYSYRSRASTRRPSPCSARSSRDHDDSRRGQGETSSLRRSSDWSTRPAAASKSATRSHSAK